MPRQTSKNPSRLTPLLPGQAAPCRSEFIRDYMPRQTSKNPSRLKPLLPGQAAPCRSEFIRDCMPRQTSKNPSRLKPFLPGQAAPCRSEFIRDSLHLYRGRIVTRPATAGSSPGIPSRDRARRAGRSADRGSRLPRYTALPGGDRHKNTPQPSHGCA